MRPVLSYGPPASEMFGVNTYTTERNHKGIQTDTSSKLPGDEVPIPLNEDGDKSKSVAVLPGVSYNKPMVEPRSTSVPGEQYGHPWKSDPSQRRTSAFRVAFVYEIMHRQDGGMNSPTDIHLPGVGINYSDNGISHVPAQSFSVTVDSQPKAIRKTAFLQVSAILNGLAPSVKESAKSLVVLPVREGVYRVTGGSEPHEVFVAVGDKGMRVNCDCAYWQWQGPEHWAKIEGYLLGDAKGLATKPMVKDPDGSKRVCKHLAAVLGVL